MCFRAQTSPAAADACQFVGQPAIFGECLERLGDWNHFQRHCVYDMCARENTADDTPMCIWVLALARACKEVGVIVDWQSSTELLQRCQGKLDVSASPVH